MKLKEETTSKSFMILTVATFITKIMSLIYVPLLLGIIQAEAHGIYTTAYDFFAFAYVITNEGITYDAIRAQLPVSSTTITRINTALHYGAGGYASVLRRLADGAE